MNKLKDGDTINCKGNYEIVDGQKYLVMIPTCQKFDGGHIIGFYGNYDDGNLVYTQDVKTFKQKDLIHIEWFNFCPMCGKKNEKET